MSTSSIPKPGQQVKAHTFYTPDCEIRIASATATEAGLNVEFTHDIAAHTFPWFWVRDHGIDALSLDHTTLQRKTDTFSIARDVRAASIVFNEAQQIIGVAWPDGSGTTISAYMLLHVLGLVPARHQLVPTQRRMLWDKDSPLNTIPEIDYETVMADDRGLLEWLQKIHIYGFCVVNHVPSTKAASKELAKRIGRIQETIFGKMWKLSSELVDHGDTAYSTQYLEPHTDSTYYHDAPGLQMFNCLEFDGKGGESVQVDGFAIAAQIKRDDPAAYQTLTEVIVPGHYIEPGVHLRAERPTFRLDSQGKLVQLSFNNYDRAPMLLNDNISERFHHAYSLLHEYVNEQDNWVKIGLRPGMTLIFDNWRNLHGRMGYVGKRVFYGCYHSRAEFESRIRVLQAAA